MPSTYAHYKMGTEILQLASEREKAVIQQYPDLFLIGVHGPDILFYYKPLFVNEINQTGYSMHGKPGAEFFTHAAKILKLKQLDKAHLSYIYGFICHFALDVTCHGYIDEKIAQSGICHAEIEVEFDREILVRKGLNPITQSLTDHIHPTVSNAAVIKDFFDGITGEQVLKSLESMISYNRLIIAPSKAKRQLIYALMKLTGNYKEMHGLMMNYQPNPNCADSTEKLFTLYDTAEKLALQLMPEFSEYLDNNAPLSEIYNYNFGSQLPE